MKKIYLFALALVLGANLAFGQIPSHPQLTNGSFESWAPNPQVQQILEPQGWFAPAAGLETLADDPTMVSVSQEASGATDGDYFIKLTTVSISNSPDPTQLPNGIYGSVIAQEFDHNVNIDEFKLDVAYEVQTGDQAIVFIEGNDASGGVVSQGIVQFTGNQAGLQALTIQMLQNPQNSNAVASYFIGIASSEADLLQSATTTAAEGSWIAIDNIRFDDNSGSSSIAVNEKNVNVFPNPANDFVTFQIDGLENGNVVISSITGQEVVNTSVNGLAKVDVSALNNGVYIYKITNSNGELIKTSKLVIQK